MKPLITTREAANLLGVSTQRITFLRLSKKLYGTLYGDRYLFSRDDVLKRKNTTNKKGGRPRKGK